MTSFAVAVYVMMYREIKRFIRARSRVIASVVNPLIWMVFFGLGWANAFRAPTLLSLFGGVDYLTYLVPGVIAMSIFTGSFISGVTVIFDRKFGFLKEVLVAPVPRTGAILGRALGDSLVTMINGALLAAFGSLLAPGLIVRNIPIALGYGLIMALGFTSAGIALAHKMTSREGFQMVMSFIMLPLVFLSGAFYPINFMPSWMKALAYVNPLTYAVDGMRYWLAGVSQLNPLLDVAVLAALSGMLVALAAIMFRRATLE
jgi:ABC-2 type transport system permease protein